MLCFPPYCLWICGGEIRSIKYPWVLCFGLFLVIRLAIDSPSAMMFSLVTLFFWLVVRLEWDGIVSVTMLMLLRAMKLMQF
jgi:hypothetical protein